LPELPLAKRPRASRAGAQKGIRTKRLMSLDTGSGKQEITGRRRRISNGFRHAGRSGPQAGLASIMCSWYVLYQEAPWVPRSRKPAAKLSDG
jgi:hypothetical protein